MSEISPDLQELWFFGVEIVEFIVKRIVVDTSTEGLRQRYIHLSFLDPLSSGLMPESF